MRKPAAAAFGAVVVACAGPALAGVELLPHKATYSMSLASSRASSGIAAATGAMTYEFADSCDGWTVSNKTTLTLAYAEGEQIDTTWDFVTWESKDGSKYRFHVRSTRQGEVTEEIDGTASVAPDKKGEVKFLKPDAKTIALPPGTLFPTEHTERLLERARANENFVSKVVFDGSDAEGPYIVTAVLGRFLAAAATPTPVPPADSWRMRMAFFPLDSKDETPEYEVGVRYFENGVATDLVQDFGNFSLRGKLDKVEKTTKPDC
ncbi:MAG: cell envelope integrity EipB family protein [Alphaproteobacteria bacterium]|nr:cell envelope integrity EipB family protein [Alphaproteobacteria bacterium]